MNITDVCQQDTIYYIRKFIQHIIIIGHYEEVKYEIMSDDDKMSIAIVKHARCACHRQQHTPVFELEFIGKHSAILNVLTSLHTWIILDHTHLTFHVNSILGLVASVVTSHYLHNRFCI